MAPYCRVALMLTMAPPPAARRAGNAARDAENVPTASISITVRNPFVLSSSATAWFGWMHRVAF